MEHEGEVISVEDVIGKETGRRVNKTTRRNHLNNSITWFDQNNEKSPGD